MAKKKVTPKTTPSTFQARTRPPGAPHASQVLRGSKGSIQLTTEGTHPGLHITGPTPDSPVLSLHINEEGVPCIALYDRADSPHAAVSCYIDPSGTPWLQSTTGNPDRPTTCRAQLPKVIKAAQLTEQVEDDDNNPLEGLFE